MHKYKVVWWIGAEDWLEDFMWQNQNFGVESMGSCPCKSFNAERVVRCQLVRVGALTTIFNIKGPEWPIYLFFLERYLASRLIKLWAGATNSINKSVWIRYFFNRI